MTKKFVLMIVSLLLFLFASGQLVAHASMQAETLDIKDLFHTWEIKQNDGIYYAQSNRILNNAEHIEIRIDTTFTASANATSVFNIENFVVDHIATQYSRLITYADETTVHQLTSHRFSYEAPEVTELLILDDGFQNWRVEIPQDIYYSVILILKQDLSSSQFDKIREVMNSNGVLPGGDLAYNFEASGYFTREYIDPTKPEDLLLLPETEGSLYDDINRMADVSFWLDGNMLYLVITYDGIYEIQYTLAEGTDTTLFTEASEAFYFTHEGGRFIVFNRGESSMFTETNWKTQTFVPYTTWNLNTNELSSIDEFNVYMYIKNEDGNNVFGYFYVDTFVIDRLLSVSVAMTYRYESIIGTTSEWINYVKILEDGNINPGSISWQLKAAAISTLATAIGSAIPGIGLPVLLIGTPITVYLQYLSYQELVDGNMLFTGNIEEIAQVAPDFNLKREIDNAYRNRYESFDTMDLDTFNLFKLHLGTFNKPFNDFKVKEDSVSVIQFKYMTDGMVYTIQGEEINTVVETDDLDPSDTPSNCDIFCKIKEIWSADVLPFLEVNWKWAALVSVASLFVIVPWMVKKFRKIRRGVKLMFTMEGLFFLIAIATLLYFVLFV
ncbi:MAG: hypothetical protein RBQ71_02920 [Acholeplasmataceae bacterium]|jgi:hypothetical protein|nr:hypothetical protein [Acholeplasmataceae bacterium]